MEGGFAAVEDGFCLEAGLEPGAVLGAEGKFGLGLATAEDGLWLRGGLKGGAMFEL